MNTKKYDRNLAVSYAKKWALSRNPRYYNFDPVGGDCTNFVYVLGKKIGEYIFSKVRFIHIENVGI